jgi:putative N6-adenine-specific DNA methylase
VFAYQSNHRYFATVTDGADTIATSELESLGARDVKTGFRGLYFSAETATLYRVVYAARLITRVLAPLTVFDCHSAKYLYRRAGEIPWRELLRPDDTFAVAANVSNSAIRHSKYAALRVKDAIVDQFREATGRRPSVDTVDPGVWVNLYIQGNRAVISLDVSGGSMHRRGYRTDMVEAPMQEHVAAAVVALTGWNGERPLVDPMCGSGTLLAEALMRCCMVPSGFLRERTGVERLPDFDHAVWRRVREAMDSGVRPLVRGLISGSDRSAEAVRAARANCRRLPGGEHVEIVQRRFEAIERLQNVTIVCNPPYGLRIGTRDAMPEFMKALGDFLKKRCTGSTAYIYVGHRELLKYVGLRTSARHRLATGGLDGRLARYELY